MTVRVLVGDCRDVLKTLPDASVHCIVTSPPYWNLRDYGVDGQIGLEQSVEAWVAELVAVFRECRRVLRDDGTCWVNLGTSYAGSRGGGAPSPSSTLVGNGHVGGGPKLRAMTASRRRDNEQIPRSDLRCDGLKPKDLIGQPWRVAFALQADGWWLRSEIIWAKPNPMPESIKDRPTKAHEQIFLLTKSERYWYDAAAIAEPASPGARYKTPDGWDTRTGAGGHGSFHAEGREKGSVKYDLADDQHRTKRELNGRKFADTDMAAKNLGESRDRARAKNNASFNAAFVSPNRKALRSDVESRHRASIPGGQSLMAEPLDTRNARTVWSIPSEPFKEAHFATFPTELPRRCILAGCPPGGTVLDPFGGAGTTGMVADQLQRDAILIELNPDYADMARRRITCDSPLFAEVA